MPLLTRGVPALLVLLLLACVDRAPSPVAPGDDVVVEAHEGARVVAPMQRIELPIEMVPAPEAISREEVERDRAQQPSAPEMYQVRDFQRFLNLFPLVRSHAAYQYLLTKTLPIVMARPAGADRAFFARLQRAKLGVLYSPMPVSGWHPDVECMVDFDDPALIAQAPNSAATTFAPGYFQPCGGTGLIRVEGDYFGHLHLNFEDPTIDCVNPDEGYIFGRTDPVTQECQTLADYSAEPRFLGPHVAQETMRIWRSAGPLLVELPFTLHGFSNVGGASVTLRFRKSNSDWFKFTNLYGHTNWLMGGWVTDVVEVQIVPVGFDPPCGNADWEAPGPNTPCPMEVGVYSLDNFAIDPE